MKKDMFELLQCVDIGMTLTESRALRRGMNEQALQRLLAPNL